MNNVLVIWQPVGTSEHSLRKALEVITPLANRIKVVEPVEKSYRPAAGAAHAADIVNDELLRQLGAGNKVAVEQAYCDDAAEWVRQAVAVEPVDLVVTAAHHSKTLFYTPLDWKLIRTLPCPLLICSSEAWNVKPVVLAAVDSESNDARQQKINGTVLAAARAWADTTGARLEVCSVIAIARPPDALSVVERSETLSKETLAKATVSKNDAKAKQQLQKVLNAHGVQVDTLHIGTGKPHEEIATVAKQAKADLVVMGSVGRKGLQGLLLGNTAEKIINHLHADLLIVKP